MRLFRSGIPVSQIATERCLAVSTIIGHLARYVEIGELSASDLMSEENYEAVSVAVAKAGSDATWTAIKELCPPEVTYSDIRLVLAEKSGQKF